MSTTQTKRPYAKRYTRLDNPPNFELTPRVIEVNSAIVRLGLCRKDELKELFPDIPPRPFDQIISHLFHNGFVARPSQQQELQKCVAGSLPSYLAPDRRGVQLHNAFFPDPVPTPKYTQDNDHMTWGYMRHQHTTSCTLINYQKGALSQSGVTFFSEPELWVRHAPVNKLNRPVYDLHHYPRLMAHDFITNPPDLSGAQGSKVPLQLSTRIDWPVHVPGQAGLTTLTIPVSTQPDGYFAEHYARTSCSFLESDEGTETILPGKTIRHSMQLFFETSLLAKYLVYITAFRKRAHVKQFGIPSFRVITMTTNPHRVAQIIEKLQPILSRDPLNIHPNFILLADRETLYATDKDGKSLYNNNPYHPDFMHTNLAGDPVHLLNI